MILTEEKTTVHMFMGFLHQPKYKRSSNDSVFSFQLDFSSFYLITQVKNLVDLMRQSCIKEIKGTTEHVGKKVGVSPNLTSGLEFDP